MTNTPATGTRPSFRNGVPTVRHRMTAEGRPTCGTAGMILVDRTPGLTVTCKRCLAHGHRQEGLGR